MARSTTISAANRRAGMIVSVSGLRSQTLIRESRSRRVPVVPAASQATPEFTPRLPLTKNKKRPVAPTKP
jgi:hypothetical protein